jgi:hypothetical protein
MRSRRRRRELADSAADLEEGLRSSEMAGGDRGTPGGQVGPASQIPIKRLEPPRRP